MEILGFALFLLLLLVIWAVATTVAVLPGLALYVAGDGMRHERLGLVVSRLGMTLAIAGWLGSWYLLGGNGGDLGIGGFFQSG